MLDVKRLIEAAVIGRELIEAALRLRGWLKAGDVGLEELVDAIRAYQKFHGLVVDGLVGSQTRRSFEAPRYCQRDRLAFSGHGALCKWNHSPVSWTSTAELPGFRQDDLLEVFSDAFSHIAEHCALRFEYTDSPNANITLTQAPIDGSGRVLADMQVPCGPPPQVAGRFDQAENFAATQNPAPGQVNIKQVARHEFLHGVGLFHRENRPPGSPPTLMDPFVSEARLIGAWEINQLQLRYPGSGELAPGIDTTTPTQNSKLIISIPGGIVLSE